MAAAADTALTPETGPAPARRGGVTLPAREGRVIWLLLGAAFVAILNETTMGVAIPHLIKDLSITALQAQWLTTGFMLTMAVVIPVTGFLLQRFTTRSVFVAAMSLFSAGTLIALLSPGFSMLVVARVVQASGTAIMMPLLMTTLMTVVPAAQRGRMMGRVSIVISLAPAIGPTLSGLLLDNLSWRWIFGIVLPIALIALGVGARWVHNLGETTVAPIDVLSVVLSAFGFGGVVFGLSQIGEVAQTSGGSGDLAVLTLSVSLGVGVVALGLFGWRQVALQRRDDALLDLRVFRSANFSLSMAQMALMSVAFFGALTVLPLYLQNVVHADATETGLVLLPGSLAMGLAGPPIGRVYDRYGTRVLLIPGAIITSAILWMFTTVGADSSVWFIAILQTVLALGLAMSFTPLFTASLASLQPRFYSYGSAVLGTVQQVAGAAGIALMITVFSAVSASAGGTPAEAGAAGARAAFLIAAIASLPLIVGAVVIRKPADEVGEPTH